MNKARDQKVAVGPRAPSDATSRQVDIMHYADSDLSESEIRREIPVFINSFNQLNYLRDTVDWFSSHGFGNVTVLDNASTLPELLEYYEGEDCLSKARVVRWGENLGPALSLHRAADASDTDAGFIFTDPDLGLPEPPDPNLLKKMFEIGLRQARPKVGLALSLDPELVDVNMDWFRGKTVAEWESRFWNAPVEENVFRASVDTTFFLFVPQKGTYKRFTDYGVKQPRIPALRVAGEGFTAVHRPWSLKDRMTPEELEHYSSGGHVHSTFVRAQHKSQEPGATVTAAQTKPRPNPRQALRGFHKSAKSLLLDAFVRSAKGPVNVVQVGAHDGKMADPIFRYLRTQHWDALLLEPHPLYFAELKRTHDRRENIKVLNLGISDQPGHVELFHLDEAKSDSYPRAARGCASLNRERVLDALKRVDARKGIETPDDHVVSTSIELRRLDAVLSDYGVSKADLLVIDVEGHERQVLDSVDLAALNPTLAIVECNGPDVEYEHELVARLARANLNVIRLGDDLVGFREGALTIPIEHVLPLAGLHPL